MTEHPEELLAAYVDGDLDAADRRAVDRHVRSCATCRSEVEMARRARRALASLPEVRAPEGTAFRVLREARRAPATGTAWRIATAAGIAASLILGGIVLVQRTDLFGGGEDSPAGQGRAADSAPAPSEQGEAQDAAGPEAAASEALRGAESALPIFRITNAKYEFDDMPAVADRLEQRANRLLADGDRGAQTQFTAASGTEDERAAEALECAASALIATTQIDDPGVPFSFETASFFDDDAGAYVPGYVAAYLMTPQPDERPSSMLLTVVDSETCSRLLYFAPGIEL